MKPEDLNFLHDTLKYLGFGENTSLNVALEEQVEQGPASFELETDACFDGESLMNAKLYFKRGKEQFVNRYFLNKYEAYLHYPDSPEKDMHKTFYIERNRKGVTFKQAFNLFQGKILYNAGSSIRTEKNTIGGFIWSQDWQRRMAACSCASLNGNSISKRHWKSIRSGNSVSPKARTGSAVPCAAGTCSR